MVVVINMELKDVFKLKPDPNQPRKKIGFEKQEGIKDTSNLKDNNLTTYEVKVIPEEKRLEQLQRAI